MPKRVIGSIMHKKLIEGDENLLEENEVLVMKSTDFDFILKERTETGAIKNYAVISVNDYIKNLEEAHKEGVEEGKQLQE